MNKGVSTLTAVPGKWLIDERTHAALQIKLSQSDARIVVSITALDMGNSAVCTLAVRCNEDGKSLEFITGLRISHYCAGEPDLASSLTGMVSSAHFRRRVIRPFVARLQSRGMY